MDALFENRLIQKIRPLYLKGRQGDWDHVQNTATLCKTLLETESGDPDIVLPAAYLHDIGWTVLDFTDFKQAMPKEKKKAKSAAMHMEKGAVIAGRILSDMGYDQARTEEIQAIIRIHDIPTKVFKLNSINATLLMEADRLDRYGKPGIQRFKTMFGEDKLCGPYWEQAKQMRIDGLEKWFRTRTAINLSRQLAKEMGLFN